MAVVLDGIVFGLQLSMLAVGLTLIYGLGGILNLAHGQFASVAAIVGAVLIGSGTPVLPALGVAVLVAGLMALVMDLTLMRPVYRLHGEQRVLLSLLVTLGVAFAIDGLLIYYHPFTRLNLSIPGPSMEILGVTMRSSSIAASLIAICALAGLILFLRFTRLGRAIRSIIQDEEGAKLCGINPSRVRTLVFVLSGTMAGVVAITQGFISSVGATSGLNFTIFALIVTVVGGLGRVSGALVAGVLLGIIHAFASFYIGAFVTLVILLAAAMATILIRPSGILGRTTG
jgi:branched-chain amino acid transport system permease protein